MLVLSRGVGERIRLKMVEGTVVWVEVLEVARWGRVRLGISAPKDVQILREEIISPDEPRRA